jgi:uncharacterized protein (DUF305 family)
LKRARTAFVVMLLISGEAFAHDESHHNKSMGQTADPSSFDSQMRGAMERMDRDMAISSTGDPDRDFAGMMIPHHQGAVEMARVELQFGKDPALRRLAQAIIVEQLQEIEVMRRRLAALPHAPRDSNGSGNDIKDQR